MYSPEIETPAAAVNLAVLEQNIASLQAYMDKHQIANRPHIKAGKIPAIAQMQVAAGIVGITCQKLGEAKVMARAGITDIFLPYNTIGDGRLARLCGLSRNVMLNVTAASTFVVDGLACRAQADRRHLAAFLISGVRQSPQICSVWKAAGCFSNISRQRFTPSQKSMGLLTFFNAAKDRKLVKA